MAAFTIELGVTIGAIGTEDGARPAPQVPPVSVAFVESYDVAKFHKGNLHTHSTESDGDASPQTIARAYRDQGYAFLALTEHDVRLDPGSFPEVQSTSFRLLPGEEITSTGGGVPVHMNALCSQSTIGGKEHGSEIEALVDGITRGHAQGALVMVNHPNFANALEIEELHAAKDADLLEIWSGHPYVYSAGTDSRPSHEALWEQLLSRGVRIFGVAVDDAHHYGETAPVDEPSRPFRAWIATYTRSAGHVEPLDVCNSLRHGHFYSSNGASLGRIKVENRVLSIWPGDPGSSRVEYLGRDGRVLEEVTTTREQGASYSLDSDEPWVRVRVTNERGERAWTQPQYTR